MSEQTNEGHLRFSFLGPRGTFCNAAALQVADDDTELIPGARRAHRSTDGARG